MRTIILNFYLQILNTLLIQNNRRIIPLTRLTALWALSESMLGGLLHAARIPFRGMIISSIAVIIICLIAHFSKSKGNILKATILVLAIKAGVSPHTPVAAYGGVFLQGLLGELFFFNKKFFALSSIALGIVVGILTGLQKIITLTLIFGATLWDAINQLVNYVIKEFFLPSTDFSSINFSFLLVAVYVSIHILFGFIAGLFASRLLVKINSEKAKDLVLTELGSLNSDLSEPSKPKKRRHWWKRPVYLLIFFISFALLVFSYANPEAINLSKSSLLIMMVRAILIMLIWFSFLSQILTKLIKKLLHKSKNEYSSEITQVINHFPFYKSVAAKVWKLSSDYRGVRRINYFLTALTINILTLKLPGE